MAFTNSTQYSPTVYGMNFVNKYSSLDKTMLSFSMWKTTIKITLYPVIESADGYASDDQIKFDRKNGLSIYLTPRKSYIFAELLKMYKADPTNVSGKGVPSGQCLITIEDPSKVNTKHPCIVIRKINAETGIVEQSYAYEVSDEYSSIIDTYDPATGQFTKDFDMFKYHELDMIILQLEEYAKAMTNAQAFAVTESLYPHLEKIASKLGVELASPYGNAGTYRNTSYFASGAGMNTGTTISPNNDPSLSQYTGKGLEDLMSND